SSAVRAPGGGVFLAGQSVAARQQADRALRSHYGRGFARAGVARSACGNTRADQPHSLQHDRPMNLKHVLFFGAALAAVAAPSGFSAEVPKAPVPVSPFIRVVYGYADVMLKHGRDKSGLFFSALDRNTLAPLTNR